MKYMKRKTNSGESKMSGPTKVTDILESTISEEKNIVISNEKIDMKAVIIDTYIKYKSEGNLSDEEIKEIKQYDMKIVRNILEDYLNNEKGEGYIYCLYNRVYKMYGDDVYKLGCTNNCARRKSEYGPGFMEDPEMILKKGVAANYRLAERLLFHLMKGHRVLKRKEFFKCNIKKIEEYFGEVQKIFAEKSIAEIKKKYGVCNEGDRMNIYKFISKIMGKEVEKEIKKKAKIVEKEIERENKKLEENINVVADLAEEIKREKNKRTIDKKKEKALDMYRNIKDREFEKALYGFSAEDRLHITSKNNKLQYLHDLHNILGTEWFDTDILTKLKKESKEKLLGKIDIPDNVYKKMCKKTMLRVIKSRKPETYIEWVSFVVGCYKKLIPEISTKGIANFSIMIGKKQRQYNVAAIVIPYLNELEEMYQQDKAK